MTDTTAGTSTSRTEPTHRPSLDPVPPPYQPLPLGYEPPQPQPPALGFETVVMFLFRRVVFAIGVGLLTYGIVAGFADRAYGDNDVAAGWGAALIALVVPFPALWRHRPMRP